MQSFHFLIILIKKILLKGEKNNPYFKDYISLDELFKEGHLDELGDSILNILASLEFLAKETMNKKLDKELISFRLIDYYYLADKFQNYFAKNISNICKLYKKLKYTEPILRKGLFKT